MLPCAHSLKFFVLWLRSHSIFCTVQWSQFDSQLSHFQLQNVGQEIKVNRTRVEEVSSFCTEISSDPNISNKEKTRVKKEAELMRERQNKQEKLSADYQRR